MPFLHDGLNGNVTITPTHLSITELKPSLSVGSSGSLATARGISPGSARLHRIIQREVAGGAAFYNNHSSSSNGGSNQTQRLAAQRKLQIAKMMSNGGGGATTLSSSTLSSFHRPQQQHGHQSQSQISSQQQQQLDRNDPMFVSSRRARSNNFTLKETFDLLKVWASTEIQWNMKHKNFRVWEAISFQMSELGHDRTAIQCKNRIQNLTSIFYRIKKSKQDYRSFNFPYYKLIGDVLDGKKSSGSLGPNSQGNLSAFTIGNDFLNMNSNNMSNISPSTQNAAGFAAHLALVEEYQHLINGQPEVYIAPTGGRTSSNNSNSGLNVLSPEVSLSEGNSPVRVETKRPGAPPSSSTPISQTTNSSTAKSNPSTSRNGPVSGSGLTLPTALLKIEHDDSVNVTMEDGTLGSELEQDTEANSDLDEQMMADEDNADGHMDEFPPPRGKRSFSTMFGSFKHGGIGNPTKRPRGLSSQSSISGTCNIQDDPIAHYLAEMVDIEKQWLELERERASNEQRMMTYMMQIMQALVSPTSGTDEEEADTEQDADNEVDEFDEPEDDAHEDEAQLRQMIDNENEGTMPNGNTE